MKQKLRLVLIIILLCFFRPTYTNAQVNVQDSLALVDLYNSTYGPGWRVSTNWLTSMPVSTWSGITVNVNRVTKIEFYNNYLNGLIPNSLSNITSLQSLQIELDDNLTGIIPASLGNLVNLQYLSLGSNHFSGTIPSSLGKLNKLIALSLPDNGLSGSIPSSLGNLTQIQLIELSKNNLTGKLPSLKNDINLQQIILWNNHLSGSIPSSLGNLIQLQVLDLGNNNLGGKVPQSLSKLYSNTGIYLDNNSFTFAGLEKLVPEFPNLTYSPQAIIHVNQNGNKLSVLADGTLANNTYKWYKNGTLYKTKVGNSNLTLTSNGLYYVDVTNSVVTALTLHSDTVNYPTPANNIAFNSNNENKFSSISVYPNPAITTTTLSFNAAGKYTINVSDVSGKIVQTKTGIAVKGENTVQLNVSKYAGGMYLITISDEKNQKQTLRLNKD